MNWPKPEVVYLMNIFSKDGGLERILQQICAHLLHSYQQPPSSTVKIHSCPESIFLSYESSPVFYCHLVEVEKQKSTNLAVGRKSIPNLLICGHSEAWRSILMISMTIKTTGKFISNGNGWIKTYRYILHVCKEPATCLSTTGTTPENKKKIINFIIFILRNLLSDNSKHGADHPSVSFSASFVTRQLPLNLEPVRNVVGWLSRTITKILRETLSLQGWFHLVLQRSKG